MGRPAYEGSADELWGPSGRSAVQVEGRSATRLERGGRSGCKERYKQRQRVKDGERYEIVLGGGKNGMNDPGNGRRNCGT